jgi:phospholipase C
MGPGFRVPLIVVSPYAKRHYISKVQHEFGSILRFTEEAFGLPSLKQVDSVSDDLSDCFDFSQTPRTFTPIRTTLMYTDFAHARRAWRSFRD